MNTRPRPRWISQLAASMVAASLLTAPVLAQAAPTLQTQAKHLPKSAKSGFGAGKVAFDGGDYARAGDEWAATLGNMPEGPQTQGSRMRLVLDTIASYREAFAADGDVGHLEAAMDTYYGYFKAYKETYGTPSIPRPVVNARHTLKAELDEAKSNQGGAAVAATSPSDGDAAPTADAASSTSDDSATTASDSSQPTTQPADGSSASSGGSGAGGSAAGTSVAVSSSHGVVDKSGTPLIAAGAAILAVGVGASSLIAVGAIEGKRAREDQKLPGYDDAQRDAIDKRGQSMNALFIAGVVVTPVLVGAGAALIGVGAKKRKQSRHASLAPMLGRGLAGVSVGGNF